MSDIISSPHNLKIKNLLQLQEKSKERREQGLFVVEGAREIALALKAGYEAESFFVYNEILSREAIGILNGLSNTKYFHVSKEVYEKLSYREGIDGMVAIMRTKKLSLRNLQLPKDALVVVLESIEKPGNLGAILRTCDAVKADAVIVCEPLADFYNPNTIRSSVGGLFSNQLAMADSEEVNQYLRGKNITMYAAELKASEFYTQHSYKGSIALVLGSEANGLSGFWIDRCQHRIKIPMLGAVDSLNVSVAASVVLYEMIRQREKK